MTIEKGKRGANVIALQNALAAKGFNPGPVNGIFEGDTERAVIAFQQRNGLKPDGVVGPKTAAALGLAALATVASLIPCVTVEMASQIVLGAPKSNVETHLPYVLNALVGPQLADRDMIAMSLATIRAETGSFEPLDEGKSQFNTAPGGPPFGLYDSKTELGNQGPPDGARFKGRGFIQLTGRANYGVHGQAIGLGNQLLDNPDLANDPEIAGRLLASFLKAHEPKIRAALKVGDLATARKLVNGGSHGLKEFSESFGIGMRVLPERIEVAQSATVAGEPVG